MSGPVATVVWLSEQPPNADAARALEAFARARGVTLRPPTEETAPTLDHAPDDALAVEAALARAREATAQLDAEACERWLARAEGRLRAHPELPQSAFMMAEVQRAWATRFARLDPKDAARAGRARAAADALDGGRATGVGEAVGEAGAVHPTVPITIAYEDGAEVRVDGRLLPDRAAGAVQLAPGEHHVTVARGGAVRFAQWVSGVEGAVLRLPSVDAAACSVADVASARRPSSDPTHPSVTARVRCGSWVAASAGERPGTVRVAWCSGATCGPSTAWTAPGAPAWPPVVENPSHGLRIPMWLVWTTAGVAAVGITTVILFASGVFDPAPRTTRFVQGGAHVE